MYVDRAHNYGFISILSISKRPINPLNENLCHISSDLLQTFHQTEIRFEAILEVDTFTNTRQLRSIHVSWIDIQCKIQSHVWPLILGCYSCTQGIEAPIRSPKSINYNTNGHFTILWIPTDRQIIALTSESIHAIPSRRICLTSTDPPI